MLFAEVMNSLNADVLKSAARRLSLPKTLTRKADLAQALGKHLDTHLDAFLEQLSERDRLFLAEAAHNGGRVSPRVFEAKHQLRAPGTGRWLGRNEASLIQLLFYHDECTGEARIAEDQVQRIRPLLPRPPAPAVRKLDEVPAVLELGKKGSFYGEAERPVHVFQGEKTVFAELRRVLSLVQAGKVRIQEKQRRPTGAAARLLAETLVVPDFDVELPGRLRDRYTEAAGSIRGHAWAVLVQQCGGPAVSWRPRPERTCWAAGRPPCSAGVLGVFSATTSSMS